MMLFQVRSCFDIETVTSFVVQVLEGMIGVDEIAMLTYQTRRSLMIDHRGH